jgi:hypothetical protein
VLQTPDPASSRAGEKRVASKAGRPSWIRGSSLLHPQSTTHYAKSRQPEVYYLVAACGIALVLVPSLWTGGPTACNMLIRQGSFPGIALSSAPSPPNMQTSACCSTKRTFYRPSKPPHRGRQALRCASLLDLDPNLDLPVSDPVPALMARQRTAIAIGCDTDIHVADGRLCASPNRRFWAPTITPCIIQSTICQATSEQIVGIHFSHSREKQQNWKGGEPHASLPWARARVQSFSATTPRRAAQARYP